MPSDKTGGALAPDTDFASWIGCGDESSFAVLPLTGDPINALRRLRKGLRDVRDRTARRDSRWRTLIMAGIASVSDGQAMVLIRHSGISRSKVWSTLSRRWPDIRIVEVGELQPSTAMNVDQTVALAMTQRGIEPLRIIIPAQRVKVIHPDRLMPMPMVF